MIRSGISIVVLVVVSLLSFLGCEVINPEEQVPAFIYLTPFEVNTNPVTEGTNNQSIQFAEVLTGDLNLGIHPVPSKIPVLLEGDHTFEIFPGIEENGISSFPNTYNFLNFENVQVDLIPGEVDTIDLQTTYRSNLEFPIQESFESILQTFSMDLDGNTNTRIVLTTDDVFEGSSSGKATINRDNPELGVGSEIFSDLPPDGSLVYVEMNYKTDIQFAVGLIWTSTSNGQETNFTNFINVTEEWNKIYLNFSEIFDFMNSTPGFFGWQLVISARVPVENGDFVDETFDVLVDNIKLIHFEQ